MTRMKTARVCTHIHPQHTIHVYIYTHMIYNTRAYTHVGVDQDYDSYENGTYNVIALKEVPCVLCTCVSRVGGRWGWE